MPDAARTAQQLLDMLETIQADLSANMKEQAKAFNLSVSELLVIRDVSLHSGTTMTDLCARLGFPKGSVSRLVDSLVSREVLHRIIPPRNRRTVSLYVSGKFRSQKARLSKAILGLFKGMPASLAKEQEERMLAALTDLGRLIRG